MSDLVYYRKLEEQLLVFPVLGKTTGIELTYIKRISLIGELIPIPRSPNYVLGIINLNGNIYPVIDLDILLSGKDQELPKNPIISLIDIGETTFGLHTHSLPSVIPGTVGEKDGETPTIPEEWLIGFEDHPEFGTIPIIDPNEFWIGLSENEMVGPSLSDSFVAEQLYEDEEEQDTEEIEQLPDEMEEDITEEEEEDVLEVDEEALQMIEEAEELASEVDEENEQENLAEEEGEAEKILAEAEAIAEEVDAEADEVEEEEEFSSETIPEDESEDKDDLSSTEIDDGAIETISDQDDEEDDDENIELSDTTDPEDEVIETETDGESDEKKDEELEGE